MCAYYVKVREQWRILYQPWVPELTFMSPGLPSGSQACPQVPRLAISGKLSLSFISLSLLPNFKSLFSNSFRQWFSHQRLLSCFPLRRIYSDTQEEISLCCIDFCTAVQRHNSNYCCVFPNCLTYWQDFSWCIAHLPFSIIKLTSCSPSPCNRC